MNRSALAYLTFIAGHELPRGSGVPNDPLKGVNIEDEYKLIQQKKSKLSARLRRIVVYRYEN